MLRPLEWTERYEGNAELADLELGVFTPNGDQIYTTTAIEEAPTYYAASITLDRKYAGQTLILRWRSITKSINEILQVFVAGERLASQVIAGIAGELPDPPAYLDDSLFEQEEGYLYNSSDTIPIPQYSAVYLESDDRDGAAMASNTEGAFFGITQAGLDTGATQCLIVKGGPSQARCASAETWVYGDPVYISESLGLVTNDPDLTTPGVWVVPIGYVFAAKASGTAVGTVMVQKIVAYQVADEGE